MRHTARFLTAAFLLSALALPAGAANPPTIAVVGKGAGGEYWVAVRNGAQKKADALGVKFVYLGTPTEVDINGQIEIIENLIQRKVDGIAISPTDSKALSNVVKKAVQKGIKVVTIDSDTVGKDRLSYIGTDNQKAGEAAGKELLKLTGGKGTLAVVTGVIGAQNLTQRINGVKKALAGSKLNVLNPQPDNGDKAKAVGIAENTLTAHPDVSAFFADNAIAGPGVAQAVTTAKKVGQVKIVSFDVTPALVKQLKAGAIQALIAQKPERMGELGVEMLAKAIKGEKIPALVDTGIDVVTTKNVDRFVH